MKVRVDFKEALGLNHEIGGYSARIVSDKATRELRDYGNKQQYHYSLDTKDVVVSADIPVEVGLYEIIDICKWSSDRMQWNVYLVVVSEDGIVPVAEYLDNPNTKWVKRAKKLVKAYFEGEELDEIDLTSQPKAKKRQERKDHRSEPGKTLSGSQKPVAGGNPVESKNQPTSKPKTKSKSTGGGDSDSENQAKPKKKSSGRSQEVQALEYGQARLMTFTGMIIGVYPILRHNKKFVEVETNKGTVRFTKEDGKQVNAEKPRYANKIEFNLKKES